ncbi:MAG: HK97 gp10 family phage protein [Ruminococcus sp.]|nr:HK97 gp10 family phage protein [Ruminococcus sp.]
MIAITSKGKLKKAEKYLEKLSEKEYIKILEKYGQKGVEALKNATPANTGKTAASWYYETEKTDTGAALVFKNSNTAGGTSVAILIRYGHGTRNGGYVEGRDYIDPALAPVFDGLAAEIKSEVRKL